MSEQTMQGSVEDVLAIHRYYIDIINCMPNIVYWMDMDCNFKGCNTNFVKLLGVRHIGDFTGTPYDYLLKHTQWPVAQVDSLKLNDMAAIFTGEAKYNVAEEPMYDKEGRPTYFLSTRVPLFDKNKHVMGLVVILNDIAEQKKTESTPAEHPSTHVSHPHEIKKTPYILMVEDNVVAQKVEHALLTALNCRVDVAGSGEGALKLFKPGKYDIIFMDIGLQDTSGYMVTKEIRKLEENTKHRVPIIALTSYEANVVKYDCSQYSMDGVLTKPMTREQALQIIEHYIYQEDISVDGLQMG